MNKYKVKYTLNEKLHWTKVLAENEYNAAINVYNQITEAYPDDDYEYLDIESDFDDGQVMEGTPFIIDGNEYKWIGRMGDAINLDFDKWAVWAAENQDTNEIHFFIVEEDTGFIDWGPVGTAEEAAEFLQSKIDEYNQDESLVENFEQILYNMLEKGEDNPCKDLQESLKKHTDIYKGILKGLTEVAKMTQNTRLLDKIADYNIIVENISKGNEADITVKAEEPSQVIDDDTSNHGMLGLVNSLIISEYDAIDQYNSAMATAEAEGNLDIIPVLKDIIAEEHTHVGQLQAAAKLFDQSAGNVDKGKEEADTQLEQGEVEQTELDNITEE